MIFQVNQYNRNKSGSKRFLKIFVSLIVLVSLFYYIGVSLLGPASPFLNSGNTFYNNFFFFGKFFSERAALVEENTKLSVEVERLTAIAHEYNSLKIENERLNGELKLRPQADFVGARILARSPQIPLDSVIIDRGLSDGIEENDLVFSDGVSLIGRVVKISNKNSVVALSSFADKNSFGFIERTLEPVEVVGVGGGGMEARLPIDFDVVPGDKVVLEGSRPYILAIVESVEENQSLGFKLVLMSLPSNILKTRIVFIEKALDFFEE